MERMTTRHNGHPALAQGYKERFTETSLFSMLLNRLTAYEDFMERWRLRDLEEVGRIFRRVNALGGTDLMAQYRDLGPIEHLRELVQDEKDGRLVVLPEVQERDRKSFVDRLQDYFHEVSFCDLSTGIFGMSKGEEELASALIDALTREEAEAALKKMEADNEAD